MKYPYLHIMDLSTIQACKLTPKAGVKVQLHHTLADRICENKVREKNWVGVTKHFSKAKQISEQ